MIETREGGLVSPDPGLTWSRSHIGPTWSRALTPVKHLTSLIRSKRTSRREGLWLQGAP